jgi:hypothetical protein
MSMLAEHGEQAIKKTCPVSGTGFAFNANLLDWPGQSSLPSPVN